MKNVWTQIGIVVLLLGLLASCVKSQTVSELVSLADATKLKCVAVLPFENRTGARHAGRAISTILSEVSIGERRFRVMDAGTVTSFLERQNIRVASVIDAEFASNLGKLLGVDGILMGTVDEYAYRDAGGKAISEPAVSISARLVDASNAKLVWSSRIRQTSDMIMGSGRDPLSRIALLAAKGLMKNFPQNVTTYEAMETCGRMQADLDIDGDAILNLIDKCPYQAESFNGVEDEDGCPEEGLAVGDLQTLVEIRNGRLIYNGEIAFEDHMDTVLPHSIQLLKAIANFLEKEKIRVPKVQVEGFSEQTGPGKFQELFAFSRAREVKKHLIRNGVDPNRLTSVGYRASQMERSIDRKLIQLLIIE